MKIDITKSPCIDCITFASCKRDVARSSISFTGSCQKRRDFVYEIADRINRKRERKKKQPFDLYLINNTLIRKENKYMKAKYGK